MDFEFEYTYVNPSEVDGKACVRALFALETTKKNGMKNTEKKEKKAENKAECTHTVRMIEISTTRYWYGDFLCAI